MSTGKSLSAFVVLLLFHPLVLGNSCTNKFMEYNLLQHKANQICDKDSCEGKLSDNQMEDNDWIMPSQGFTCSGSIMSFIFAGDIRPTSTDNFPTITLWTAKQNKSSTEIYYVKVPGNERTLNYHLYNFSTTGPLHYHLTNPLHYNKGDFLGLENYNESTGIRLYYIADNSSQVYELLNAGSTIDLDDAGDSINRKVLLLPVTDAPYCLTGFPDEDTVVSKSRDITVVSRYGNNARWFFLNLRMSCDGHVTHVLFGAIKLSNDDYLEVPRIQLRRFPNGDVILDVNISVSQAIEISKNLFMVNLSTPVPVKEGDFLALYQPMKSKTSFLLYQQKLNGPENFRQESNQVRNNNFPLISFIVSTNSLPTNFVPELILVTATVSAVLVLVLIIIIAAIVILIVVKCRRKKLRHCTYSNRFNGNSQANDIVKQKEQLLDAAFVTNIEGQVSRKRESVDYFVLEQRRATVDYSVIEDEDELPLTESHKETSELEPPPTINETNKTFLRRNITSIKVPSARERKQYNTNDDQNTTDNQNVYTHLHETQSQYSTLNRSKSKFFVEEPIYWEPKDNTDSIYQQLSDRKYREIVRHKIQITKCIGSGQFGTVSQGVWNASHGSVDVAIKTLNDDISEEEKVKFLQEAAIMGQFHHPNIVKLCGVVTIGEPIMIILELVTQGDLREYLQKFQPLPGELVISTLPSLLLTFSQQIASGMKYLSNKCFVHRDLAARNILVTEQAICKIADFGMSRDLQDENYYISNAKKIPVRWTAPEALHFKRYSTASDVWSYGAVLYEIWSVGHKPFEGCSNSECMKLIDSGYRLPPPPGCPRAIYEIMIQCWHPESHSRPTFVKLVSDLSQVELTSDGSNDTVLGGPLESAHNIYIDLQKLYVTDL